MQIKGVEGFRSMSHSVVPLPCSMNKENTDSFNKLNREKDIHALMSVSVFSHTNTHKHTITKEMQYACISVCQTKGNGDKFTFVYIFKYFML